MPESVIAKELPWLAAGGYILVRDMDRYIINRRGSIEMLNTAFLKKEFDKAKAVKDDLKAKGDEKRAKEEEKLLKAKEDSDRKAAKKILAKETKEAKDAAREQRKQEAEVRKVAKMGKGKSKQVYSLLFAHCIKFYISSARLTK